MNRIEKMFRTIDNGAEIPAPYQLSTAELLAIHERYAGNILDTAIALYRYGFSRGQNYSKNSRKEIKP